MNRKEIIQWIADRLIYTDEYPSILKEEEE